jgi:hypothetical protein
VRVVHIESPARERLASCLGALARLAAEQRDVDSTLTRARAALAAEAEAERALAEVIARDDERVARWLEHPEGPRPNPDTIRRRTCEKTLRDLRPAAAGARSGMPGFEERARELAERAGILQRQRRLALLGVALEEAQALVREYLRVLEHAANAFGSVAAAELALKELAGQDPEGLRQLEDFLEGVPKLAGLAAADVDRSLGAWRRWVGELARDPAADLLDALL